MRAFILPVAALLTAGIAQAQEAPLSKVYACAGIQNADERLACYDGAVAGLKSAEASGGVSVVSREQVVAAEEGAFGLGPATLADVTRSAAPPTAPKVEALDNIKVTVTSAVKKPGGGLRFTLDNGQVWEEIDTSLGRVSGLPASGEIRKGALSSYMLKIGDKPTTRVKRVR